jgi:hypothetical protein
MTKKFFAVTTTICLVFVVALKNDSFAQFSFDAETGAVISAYNDVRIPGEGGTFLSLSDELSSDIKAFIRLRAGYRFGKRHEILALYAPLKYRYAGSVSRDVFFQGINYPTNAPISATYKFNSYRLSYRYYLLQNEKLEIGLGLTLKIRDALIGLESNGLGSEKTDFGFVPLLNFKVEWNPFGHFGFLLDADAAAAPQGRAEDILAAVTWKTSKKVLLKAGYRILEGGADNKKVYTFSMFHYALAGAIFSF